MNEFEVYVNLLTTIAEKTLKIEPNSLNVKKKTDKLVLGRMVVCNILMDGGLSPSKLSNIFVQDRSNYYHYRKQHTKFVQNPKIYPMYLDVYSKVLQEFEDRTNIISLSDLLTKLDLLDDIDRTVDTLTQQRGLLEKTLTN